MNDYKQSRKWSDEYLPQVKSILGQYFFKTSSDKDDREKASDITINGEPPCNGVAVRLRDSKDYDKYGNEFTLRSRRKSGSETELSKILRGYGDWLFYGFADNETKTITHYCLLDLAIFRNAWIDYSLDLLDIQTGETKNNDGTTWFRWFDISSFPSEIVLDNK